MIFLLTAITLAAVALAAALVHRGFRDGDQGRDAMVSATASGGRWVQVTVTNPGESTALVALGLRGSRLPEWASAGAARRAGGRRALRGIADRSIGAVSAGDAGRFWLWWDGAARRVLVVAAVGTPGRLRLHRVPVVAGGGAESAVPVASSADAWSGAPL